MKSFVRFYQLCSLHEVLLLDRRVHAMFGKHTQYTYSCKAIDSTKSLLRAFGRSHSSKNSFEISTYVANNGKWHDYRCKYHSNSSVRVSLCAQCAVYAVRPDNWMRKCVREKNTQCFRCVHAVFSASVIWFDSVHIVYTLYTLEHSEIALFHLTFGTTHVSDVLRICCLVYTESVREISPKNK